MGPSHLLAKLFDPIAEVGGLLKIEFLGRLFHLDFELIDQLRQRLERQSSIWIVLQSLGCFAHNLNKIGIRAILFELSGELKEAQD